MALNIYGRQVPTALAIVAVVYQGGCQGRRTRYFFVRAGNLVVAGDPYFRKDPNGARNDRGTNLPTRLM